MVKCRHEWIMTPWNPTFTDPGRWRLYACLQCGASLTAKEIDDGVQRNVLDEALRFTMRLEKSKKLQSSTQRVNDDAV